MSGITGAENTDKPMRLCEINKKNKKNIEEWKQKITEERMIPSTKYRAYVLCNIKYQRIRTIVEQFNVKSLNRT